MDLKISTMRIMLFWVVKQKVFSGLSIMGLGMAIPCKLAINFSFSVTLMSKVKS